MKRPEFLIVGAPKCATTTLDTWLGQHPQVFMAPKERHFFGRDLIWRTRRRTLERYLDLFQSAESDQRCGEASVFYLYSQSAPQEIIEFNPQMKIIIMLRPPVDFMRSLHNQTYNGLSEPLEDFEAALEAEPHRIRTLEQCLESGREPGEAETYLFRLFYRRYAHFSDHVQRYLQAFPPDQVKVLLMEDLRDQPQQTYRDVLRFLEVDDTFEAEFVSKNRNKRVRSRLVQRLIERPPWVLRRLEKALFRLPVRSRVRDAARRWNVIHQDRTPMEPELEARLKAEYAPEVQRLSQLLGRDLSHWKYPTPQATS